MPASNSGSQEVLHRQHRGGHQQVDGQQSVQGVAEVLQVLRDVEGVQMEQDLPALVPYENII